MTIKMGDLVSLTFDLLTFVFLLISVRSVRSSTVRDGQHTEGPFRRARQVDSMVNCLYSIIVFIVVVVVCMYIRAVEITR